MNGNEIIFMYCETKLFYRFSLIYHPSIFSLCLEAHRALELLEDYHAKLTRPQDKQLRLAIERVIRIFKSRLFQALLGKSCLLSLNFLALEIIHIFMAISENQSVRKTIIIWSTWAVIKEQKQFGDYTNKRIKILENSLFSFMLIDNESWAIRTECIAFISCIVIHCIEYCKSVDLITNIFVEIITNYFVISFSGFNIG